LQLIIVEFTRTSSINRAPRLTSPR
jgi:hypothetical protein